MEGGVNASQGLTRPRVAAEVQAVLMSLGLVLVLEAVWAVLALVLLLHCVKAARVSAARGKGGGKGRAGTYSSSSLVSNFFGFFGQHSQTKKPCILATLFWRECE
jgi:hypothetical protein